MSDSVRPHGLQPTRLFHPWDFPGKSTGVRCHIPWENHNSKGHMDPDAQCQDMETTKMSINKWMDKEMCYIYTKEYYSATEGNEFESVELRWMNLEPVIQSSVQFSSVALLYPTLFATPWTAARQASLSITTSQSLLKLMSIESVMSSNHLIFCCPLLLPSVFPSIRIFSSESVLRIR